MTNKLMLELRQLNFLAKRAADKGDRYEADKFRRQANDLADTRVNPEGLSSDELRKKYVTALAEETETATKITQDSDAYRAAFIHFVRTGDWTEKRDVQVGTSTLAYSQLTQGGVLMDIQTETELTEAVAAVDPLLSDAVVDFKMSGVPFQLKPITLRGIDLSTVKAQNIAETVQQTPQAFTFGAAKTLRPNIAYRFALAASLEADEDIPDWLSIYARTAGIAFARQLGVDAAIGNGGTNTPAGLFPYLGPSILQTSSGSIKLSDINTIFKKVDAAYRAQPKCAWLCSENVHDRLLNAVDSSNRPLIDVVDGSERLRGKPIYISPSLSNALTSEGFGALIFGDLSKFKVRTSKPWFMRQINQKADANGNATPGDITKGQCLYVARVKMDSVYLDPSNGGSSPIVWAAVTT